MLKKLLQPQWQLKSTTLILILAAFFTLSYNYYFFSTVVTKLNLYSPLDIFLGISLLLCLIAGLNLLFNCLFWPYMYKPIFCLLIIMASITSYFTTFDHIQFTQGMMANVFNTNAGEASELISTSLVLWVLILGILPSILLLKTRVRVQPWGKAVVYRVASCFISLIIALGVFLPLQGKYLPLIIAPGNCTIKYTFAPTNFIQAGIAEIKVLLASNMPFKHIGMDAHKAPKWAHHRKKTLVVLVVGETSRAANFSLNGYQRDTNPLLKKDHVVSFKNTYSCGTYTELSVPCMFSYLTRKQYSASIAQHQSDLVDILARAGFDVLWRDNDSGCFGTCRSAHYIDAKHLAKNKSAKLYDNLLLQHIQTAIQKQRGDTVLILHVHGSHGTYHDRYPASFAYYKPYCQANGFRSCSHQSLVNAYDNTIRYTDQFLDKVITLLKHNNKKYDTAMVYLSDHGESLGEHGFYAHGAPYAIAPDFQKHIPLIVWLSKSYAKSFNINTPCLQQHINRPYSQDNLFHSMLGLMAIKTKLYNPKLDIFASCHPRQIKK
jgi:lipid A ethanolaminephosphotransferase